MRDSEKIATLESENSALREQLMRLENELDVLSASHKDLAHRLARAGNRVIELEAMLACIGST